MNNRRVWDCIRAGGEVIVLLILFYRSLLWVLLIGTPLCFLQYRRLKRKWELQHRWLPLRRRIRSKRLIPV